MKIRIAAIFAVLTVLAFSLSAAADSSDYFDNVSKLAQADVPANMAINERNGVATSFNGDIAVFPDFFGVDQGTGNLCFYVRVENETSKQMTISVEGQGEMFPGENLMGEITLAGGEEGYVKFGIIEDYTTHNYSEYPPTGKFWAKDSSAGDDAKSSFSSTKFGALSAQTMEIALDTRMLFLPEEHWSCYDENEAFSYDEENGELIATSKGSITFVGTSENNELLLRVVSTIDSSKNNNSNKSTASESEEDDTIPVGDMDWISFATPEAFKNIEPTYFKPDDTGAADNDADNGDKNKVLEFINQYVNLSDIDFADVGKFLLEHDKEIIIAIIVIAILRSLGSISKVREKRDNNKW